MREIGFEYMAGVISLIVFAVVLVIFGRYIFGATGLPLNALVAIKNIAGVGFEALKDYSEQVFEGIWELF